MGITIEAFDSESFCGYTQITTSYTDFSIAEKFGVNAIKDTYKNLFRQFKKSYKELTELVMVLNWKAWRWSEKDELNYEVYYQLWKELDEYACENLKGDELSYFYETTD